MVALFIISIINALVFYKVEYKYYKEHGEWDDRPNVFGGPFMYLIIAVSTFAFAVAILLDKCLG